MATQRVDITLLPSSPLQRVLVVLDYIGLKLANTFFSSL